MNYHLQNVKWFLLQLKYLLQHMTLTLKTIISFMYFIENSPVTTHDRDAEETLSISLFL